MQFDWWTFALQLVNFAVLAWLLQRFLYRPVTALIERRQGDVAAAFAKAEKAQRGAEDTQQTFERQASDLEVERKRVLDAAHADAAAERDRMLAATEAKMAEIEREAKRDLDAARRAVMDGLERSSLELAVALSGRLLSSTASIPLCETFLEHAENHLAGLTERERSDLMAEQSTAKVTTAPALDGQTRGKWTERLRRLLGQEAQFDFATDPELLTGVELDLPRARLSFTLADTLVRAQRQLTRDAGSEDGLRTLVS